MYYHNDSIGFKQTDQLRLLEEQSDQVYTVAPLDKFLNGKTSKLFEFYGNKLLKHFGWLKISASPDMTI